MIKKEELLENEINFINEEKNTEKEKENLVEKIKEILPNIVNSDNILNIQALQDLINKTNTSSNNQGYELTFAGKGFAKAKKDEPTQKELRVELGQSKNFNETENIIIRGDNLDALKILKQNYHNKIKMIYIDPPYNTQSENFIYNDNFRVNDEKLIEELGLNEDTKEYLTNIYGTRSHSGWLSFMYPRLLLARDLLSDDGVIFISIDDNEQANLKILCDEVFGGENFVANMIWQDKYTTTNDKNGISSQTDYILCYSKNINNINFNKLPLREEYIKETYINDDNDNRGKYRLVQMYKKKNPYSYEVVSPTGKIWNMPWNFTKENFKQMDKENKIYWGKDGDAQPQKKVYLNDSDGINPINLLLGKDVGFSGDGGNEIEKIFNNRNIFSYPKNTKLLKHILKIATQKNSIILDFFAGSGTTAHSVLDLNKEDGGNRKFILVQLDEEINKEKNKSAYDFCVNEKLVDKRVGEIPFISDITIERVNRAGEKIKEEVEKNNDLLTQNNLDIGYKVFSLVDKAKLDFNPENSQFELFNQRKNTFDTLYNMIVISGVELISKIEEIEKDNLYFINGSYYVLNSCDLNLINKDFTTIYLDGYSNTINLELALNLKTSFGEDKVVAIY